MNLSVDIKKRFSSGQTPFHLEVAFSAAPGITVLFGPSGAGKSITLDCIAGISRPDTGCIQIGDRILFERDGAPRPRVNLALRNRRVGYVFQHLGLFEHLSVLENVRYGLAHVPRTEAHTIAEAMLDQLGIAHTKDRRPGALSGGERQRVALARTLVVHPDVLLLDEPLSALDAATKRGLIIDLQELRRRLEIPILYVSHDIEEVCALGESVLVYEQGKIVFTGTPQEVIAR